MGKSIELLSFESWLALPIKVPLLDVRSPAEFKQGHVPGAVSFPLFTDAERAEVGTLYKQVSPESAFLRGLELVGPKMADFVRQAVLVAPDKKVVVQCWRGGQRSQSMAWLLQQAGFEVAVLAGGYKAFRNEVLKALNHTGLKLIRVGGPTGSGKTDVLHALKELGEQIIDLEALANHRGSAFGDIGLGEQPSNEHFENLLFAEIEKLEKSKFIWIEDESRGIGKVFQPSWFFRLLIDAPMVLIDVPLLVRAQHLVGVYDCVGQDALIDAFDKIKKRLAERCAKAQQLVREGQLIEAACIALQYYDKAYAYSLEASIDKVFHRFQSASGDSKSIAAEILTIVNEKHHLSTIDL